VKEVEETVISSEEIYKGKVVHLRVDTVRLSDGKEAKREVVAHPGSVSIVAVQADGNVLLVRQFRLPAGKVLLEVPAGTLEAGEEPHACALRELEEETGYKAQTLRPLFSAYLAPGYTTELNHAFLATDLTRTQTNFDEGEDLELVSLPLAEAVQRVLAGELQDAKSIAALFVARQILKTE
jgi:8-oxo-dGTP pyrophosphatase MutT (NUDIX family)